MNDNDNDTGDSKRGGRMGLRSGDAGRVRQSFSGGRTKAVVVEQKKKRRILGPNERPGGGAAPAGSEPAQPAQQAQPKPSGGEAARPPRQRPQQKSGQRGQMLPALSADEAARRMKALETARKVKAESDAAELARAAKAAEEAAAAAKAQAEADAAARIQAEADAAAVESARRKAEAEAEARRAEEAAAPKAQPAPEPEKPAAPQSAAAGDRPARPAGDRPASDRPARPAGDRPASDRPARPAGDRPARPAGDRPAGDRPARPAGDRPYGDRPARPAGDRPYGDRPARPAGDRPERRRPDDGPRVGSAVDISALTPRLPGPKIISRAADRPATPSKAEAQRARTRPVGTGGEETPFAARPGGGAPARPGARPDSRDEERTRTQRNADKRRAGKLTISDALHGEEGGRQRSLAAIRRRQERDKRKGMTQQQAKVVRDVRIPEAITVQELAQRMAERGADVVKALMKMGMMVTINQPIDPDTAQIVVEEFGHRFTRVAESDVEDVLTGEVDAAETLVPRAPIVTIMGHVDHGKTSLLDALRKTNVVSGEAGGITQHIGAYQVETEGGRIAFLDTPGHAAFTAMRARGAHVTDIVILVVAADDSVMPQTIEAINHAKAANVPLIVAINKIDKPAADANRVRTSLLQYDVQVEAMGGEVMDVEVSAVTGQGLPELLEKILLQAEILELTANPGRNAEGAVVEARLDVGRGNVATVLVQRGTLKVGDVFVVGETWGKVRALIDDHGDRIDSAGPSMPCEVLGLTGTPEAGDTLVVVDDESKAREIADYRHRKAKERAAALGARAGASLDQLLARAKEEENVKYLPVVIKSDVQGSAEAIVQALEKVGNDEVKVRVLHSGVGAITESDVTLAEASGAPIIGFNVRANAAAREGANQKGVELRYYSIIYDLVDDVKKAASGLLSPEIKETFIGYAQILQVFKISNAGNVAGCRITEGVARRDAGVRLLRDNVVIHQGKLKTLKRFKDEVKEVQGGQECGMAFERYEDMREGDVIEIFETQSITRTL